jgi:hypothetical protein
MAEHPKMLVKAGVVVVGAFLVTQITLEFNRTGTLDYAQFILALMGLFVGVADRGASVVGDRAVNSVAGT